MIISIVILCTAKWFTWIYDWTSIIYKLTWTIFCFCYSFNSFNPFNRTSHRTNSTNVIALVNNKNNIWKFCIPSKNLWTSIFMFVSILLCQKLSSKAFSYWSTLQLTLNIAKYFNQLWQNQNDINFKISMGIIILFYIKK